MQIFKSKLAKTETATVQLNADEILKLKKALGAPLDKSDITLVGGVTMRQLPNRWFTVEASDDVLPKIERIQAALMVIEAEVNAIEATAEAETPVDVAEAQDEPVAVPKHGGGHSAKTPPSQLLVKMFSRIGF